MMIGLMLVALADADITLAVVQGRHIVAWHQLEHGRGAEG